MYNLRNPNNYVITASLDDGIIVDGSDNGSGLRSMLDQKTDNRNAFNFDLIRREEDFSRNQMESPRNRLESPISRQEPMIPSSKYGITGLDNVGGYSCYVNSTIQCLNHTFVFREYLLDLLQFKCYCKGKCICIGGECLCKNKCICNSDKYDNSKPYNNAKGESITRSDIVQKIIGMKILDKNISVIIESGKINKIMELASKRGIKLDDMTKYGVSSYLNHKRIDDAIETIRDETLVFQLTKLMFFMWKNHISLRPATVLKLFHKINPSLFPEGRQGDAHEAIIYILDTCHEELCLPADIKFTNNENDVGQIPKLRTKLLKLMNENNLTDEKKKELQAIRFEYDEYKRTHYKETLIFDSYKHWKKRTRFAKGSGIMKFFEGVSLSCITCTTCSHKSHTFNSDRCLVLAIPDKQSVTLDDCLEHYSKCDILENNDKYNCPSCKKFVKATKKMEIWDPSDVLIIVLKRFTKLHAGTTKNIIPVVYNHRLNISPYISEISRKRSDYKNYLKFEYELQAVQCHHGGYGSGHYTAYCKNSYDDTWYRYNDSITTPVNKESVIDSNAYILWYKYVGSD